jgi:hypothetical protein
MVRTMSNRDEYKSSEEAMVGTLPSELLTKKELARRLKISQRKIEMDENFPAIRWGRSIRYDWQEVVAYLKGGAAE